jgi:Uma2 family endonuclease
MLTAETLTKRYTIEEFWELDLPEEDGPYELIRGEIVPRKREQGPSVGHGKAIAKLLRYLEEFLEGKQLGLSFTGSPCLVDSVSGDQFIPDVAFVAQNRLPIDETAPLPFSPDLAVEIVSRSDSWFKVRDKVEDYLKAGTRLVWVIFPPDKLIFVYRPNEVKPGVLFFDDTLDGEAVIPGFKLEINKIFE